MLTCVWTTRGAVPTFEWIHSLFLGGWKEANHLHRLLQPLEIMTQIFLILDLKVFLKERREWHFLKKLIKIKANIYQTGKEKEQIKNRLRNWGNQKQRANKERLISMQSTWREVSRGTIQQLIQRPGSLNTSATPNQLQGDLWGQIYTAHQVKVHWQEALG